MWVERIAGTLLIAAAALKAHQLFAGHPVVSGILHYRIVSGLLIQAEILLGVWLLTGGGPPRARFRAALICFTLFGCVAACEAAMALPSCGCFGNIKLPPAITAAMDFIIVVALWFFRAGQGTQATPSNSIRKVWAGGAMALLASTALWAGYFLTLPQSAPGGVNSSAVNDHSLVILEPEKWKGQPFPLFDDIEGGDPLKSGRWIVIFYHPDCESCMSAIPNYQALASSAQVGSPGIAFVVMPGSPATVQDPVAPSLQYLRLSLRDNHDWFATTPLVAAIENGTVVWFATGNDAINPPSAIPWPDNPGTAAGRF